MEMMMEIFAVVVSAKEKVAVFTELCVPERVARSRSEVCKVRD